MTDFRYTLERGSRKFTCPECGKKTYVRYLDSQTSGYLPEKYGRCDREVKCGYQQNPYSDRYGQDSGINTVPNYKVFSKKKLLPTSETTSIPLDVLQSTLKGYEQNIFVQNLLKSVPFPFDVNDVERVVGQYYLGTIQSGFMAGSVTFPFIDTQERVMAIQVKQFDNNNHAVRTSFLHSMIEHETKEKGEPLPEWLNNYKNNEKKVSCLFGAHLLGKYPSNPIALVEAPKTAIYGSLYFGLPQSSNDLIWLAVFNLSSLTLEKCRVLQGRRVVLFPDLSKEGKAYRLWEQRASEFNKSIPGAKFVISDLLEKNASEEDREKGLDLGDYLIRMDWRAFRPENMEFERKEVIPATTSIEKDSGQVDMIESSSQLQPGNQQPVFQCQSLLDERKKERVVWPIEELESFFNKGNLPTTSVQLDSGTHIHDVQKFVTGHLKVVKANNGKATYKPYYDRLLQLKTLFCNY